MYPGLKNTMFKKKKKFNTEPVSSYRIKATIQQLENETVLYKVKSMLFRTSVGLGILDNYAF